MTTKRIDNLRNLVAKIGAKQTEYQQFFASFADRLESELGEYLGCKDSVALCCAYGSFTFDKGSYRCEGLGFEDGRYRIPLMFRLKNLGDDGDLQVRVRVYFTKKDGEKLSVTIDGETTLEMNDSEFVRLNDYIYRYLCKILDQSTWFEHGKNPSAYQCTGMGFLHTDMRRD